MMTTVPRKRLRRTENPADPSLAEGQKIDTFGGCIGTDAASALLMTDGKEPVAKKSTERGSRSLVANRKSQPDRPRRDLTRGQST